jgi:hypothetical protein
MFEFKRKIVTNWYETCATRYENESDSAYL